MKTGTPKVSIANESLLRSRGNANDRELNDATWLVDIRLAGRISPLTVPQVAVGALFGNEALKRARSKPDSIGSYVADIEWLTGRLEVVHPGLERLGLGLIAGGGAFLVGFPWWTTALLGLACMVVLSGLVPTVAAALAGVAIVVVYPAGWWWVLVAAYLALMLILMRRTRSAVGGGAAAPGLGFIPRRAVLSMFLRGVWSNFAIGVDKALGDDVMRADVFLSAVEDQVGAYTPVLVHARALAFARLGDTTRALELVSGCEGMEGLPAPVQGWCALVVSDILALAGQDQAAQSRLRHAIPLLKNRRAAGARIAAQLRLVDAAVKGGECDEAIALLTGVRWAAIRSLNADLLATTEGYLAQMMLGVGNESGAIWALEQIGPRDGRRGRMSESASRLTMWSVLHAQIALQRGQNDEALRQAENAVERADTHADLGVRAAAHLTHAEVSLRVSDAQSALPHILVGLGFLQRIRYGLPSSNWRRNWVRLNARAYELALEIAGLANDPHLVEEVLESIRAQAVPVGVDRMAGGLDAFLSALLDPLADRAGGERPPDVGQGLRATSLVLAAAGSDPLCPPGALYVEGSSWIGGPAEGATDLDRIIVETVGEAGWYWSACIAAGSYWWTMRTPWAEWTWGSLPLDQGSPGRAAFDSLLRALPIRQQGESVRSFNLRSRSSPLLDPDNGSPELEDLLTQVATAFLPPPLREAIGEAPDSSPLPILVSLSGALAAIPLYALPVGPHQRLIDVAMVAHAPAPALLAALKPAPEELSLVRPISLAVVDPDPNQTSLDHATAPDGAVKVLSSPTTKGELEDALRQADSSGVFCAFAHYVTPPGGAPASGGIAVADGIVSLRDLLTPRDTDGAMIRVPERALLSMCESLAAGAGEVLQSGDAFDTPGAAWEWLGLSAGFMLAGARHVVATAWPIPDLQATDRLDHAIAQALTTPRPASAVRSAILESVSHDSSKVPVMVWAAYSYVGTC